MAAKPKLTIPELLRMFPEPVCMLAEELRPIVRKSMPSATEAAYPGWRAIGYRDKFAGYVCGIFLFEDHVRLIFEHGHLLSDPDGILEGATKQTRHVTLRPGQPIPAAAIQDLVGNAVALGAALKTPQQAQSLFPVPGSPIVSSMTLELPRAVVDEMVAHAREDLPNECCGLITAKDGETPKLYRTRNAEASPFRYVVHPLDLLKVEQAMDDTGAKLLVIYHSHVASDAYPSPTDVRMAAWPGSNPPEDLYPGTYYVLVSLKDADNPSVRAYQIKAGEITEEPLKIT